MRYIFLFILLNILHFSLAQEQKSFILRDKKSSPTGTPPPPPIIRPNPSTAIKSPKSVPTNNPKIESAQSDTKSNSGRDSNPAVSDINPKPPKNPENKPKTETPVTPKTSNTNNTTANNPKAPENTPKTSNTGANVTNPKNTSPNKENTPANTKPPVSSNSTDKPKNETKPLPNNPKVPTTVPVSPNPSTPTNTTQVAVSEEVAMKNAKALRIAVDTALSYIGVKYLAGGMSREGMDCSGLVNFAYKSIGLKIPRTSRDLSEFGVEVKEFTSIKVGDLVFFDSNDSKRINHVGMVIRITPEQIWFIHATSSKGVREDKLIGAYWTPRHRKTMRVLPN